MKILDKVMIVFFNLFLLIIAVWVVIMPITTSKSYYMSRFEKANTIEETGYSKEELDIIITQIIDYLMDDEESMQVVIDDTDVFSYQALKHMKDVKVLYTKGQIIAYIILFLEILIGVYLVFFYKRLKTSLFKTSLVTIIVVVIIVLGIGIYALSDFDRAFVLFHKIIFPDPEKFKDAFFSYQSNYPEIDINPNVDNQMLIKILSIGVFSTAGLFIAIGVIAVEIIWFITLIILHNKQKYHN